jgi:hypothetical protein
MNKQWITKKATCIELFLLIKDIYPSVEVYDYEFYEELKASIERDGLLRPLVVVPMTVREWKELCESNPHLLPPPNLPDEEVVYQIRCGNNRYWAAMEAGVKSIMVHNALTMQGANKMCKQQQKEMKQWKEDGIWVS